MKKIALLGAVGVLGLSGLAAAQTVTTDGTGTSTTIVTTSSGTTSTTSSGTTSTTTTGTTTAPSTAGAYDHLSPGNKAIVDALYNSQVQPPPQTTTSTTTTGTTTTASGGTTTSTTITTTPPTVKTPLTRDEIAAMGPGAGGQGWGKVFQDMKANGYTDAKNLGEVVSSYHHDVNADRKGTSTADSPKATSGSANVSTASASGRGKFVRDDTMVGITTGRGVTEVASRGNGGSKSDVTSAGHSSSSGGAVSHGVSAGVSNAGGNAGGNSGSHGGGNGKH